MQKKQYKLMYQLEDSHWWFLAKRNFIKKYLPLKKNLRILDLGCGTGGTSIFLGSWGKVTGVERNPVAYPYLDKRGLSYYKSTIEDMRFKRNSYDLVCLLDVLYHRNVSNLDHILKIARKALKKNGILLITDSALPILFSHHDKVMQTRKRFYLSEMENYVKTAGFKTMKKSYIYFFLFPCCLVSRIIDKIIPYETVSQQPEFINQAFLRICRFEASLLSKLSFPIGSSIILLAKKP